MKTILKFCLSCIKTVLIIPVSVVVSIIVGILATINICSEMVPTLIAETWENFKNSRKKKN